jgi:hypothetical protein
VDGAEVVAAVDGAAPARRAMRLVVQLEDEEPPVMHLRFRLRAARRNWQAAPLPQRDNAVRVAPVQLEADVAVVEVAAVVVEQPVRLRHLRTPAT